MRGVIVNKNKYRALFLIDETQEYTNNFYVFEFTKIVLFEAGFLALSIDEIVEKIEELAGLKYTEREVLSAIEQWNSGCIERKSKKYSLTTLGLELMSNRAQAINIKQYTDLFLKEQSSDCKISAEELRDLVEKFIFLRFNENLKQICDIFNQSLAIEEIEEDFDDEQREIINDFLNWNNNDKNKCIYLLIAKAYDYCMINSRCSKQEMDFSKFHFYIDTNIIFRMLGINGALRQNSINNLIEKCLSVGAHLHINNFVKDECEHTIVDQIKVLQDTTSELNGLLPPSSMGFAEEHSVRIDFYTKYFYWVKSGNFHRNYEGFKKKILSDLSKIVDKFETEPEIPSYKVTKKKDFDRCFDALYERKGDKHTTATDVNSFLLVQDKRRDDPESEYYLISADKKFISWLKDDFPTSKSFADYPSTWLSILLKYTGREKDTDYKSFCQFIHLSINPKVQDLEKKIAIKAKILVSDFSDTIKSMMIDDIKNNYQSYSEYDTDEIIHMAYAKTEKQLSDEISAKKEQEFNEKYETKVEERLKEEREKEERRIQDIEAEKEEKIKEAYERGKKEQAALDKEKNILKEINRIINRNKIISILFSVVFVVFVAVALLVWVLFLLKGKISPECEFIKLLSDNPLWVSVFSALFATLIKGLKELLKKLNVLTTDESIIRKRVERKTSKD